MLIVYLLTSLINYKQYFSENNNYTVDAAKTATLKDHSDANTDIICSATARRHGGPKYVESTICRTAEDFGFRQTIAAG